MSNELQVLEGGPQLAVLRRPEAILTEAENVAKVFQAKAMQMQLYKAIGESKHLQVEGWQLLGHMFNCTARYVEDRFVEAGNAQGYEAVYEIVHVPSGMIVSRGAAMCLNDEERWCDRPKYDWQQGANGKREKVQVGWTPVPLQQLRSMAQTRAESKAFSNAFRFVAKMGGFAGTPGEEMEGNEYGDPPPPQSMPQSKSASAPKPQPSQGGNGNGNTPDAGGEELISENQGKRMYAIAMGVFRNDKGKFNAWLDGKGFQNSRDIPKVHYDALIQDLQAQGGA